MEKQKKGLNVLYSILIFWENRKAFFTFLFFIAFPLFLISSVVFFIPGEIPFIRILLSGISWLAYFIMILFTISYTVLYKVSKKVELPFIKTLRLMPAVGKKAAFISAIFAILIVLSRELIVFAPYILLVIFPIVGFLSVYKSTVPTTDLFKENKTFLSTNFGKGLVWKIILMAFVFSIAVSIINAILNTTLSFLNNDFIFAALFTIKLLLSFLAFFIIFLFANLYYVEETFSVSREVHSTAMDILTENKRARRDKKEKSRRFKTERDVTRNEINRFTQNDEYNRFENTKF